MSEFILIYIYTVLQNMTITLGLIGFITIIVFGIAYGNSKMNAGYPSLHPNAKENHENMKALYVKFLKRKIVIFFIVLFFSLSVFLPSKSDIKTIIAGGLIWKGGKASADIKGIEELPENVVNAMNAFLKGIDATEKKDKQ